MTRYQTLMLLCDEKILKSDGKVINAGTANEAHRMAAERRKQIDWIKDELLRRLRKTYGV